MELVARWLLLGRICAVNGVRRPNTTSHQHKTELQHSNTNPLVCTTSNKQTQKDSHLPTRSPTFHPSRLLNLTTATLQGIKRCTRDISVPTDGSTVVGCTLLMCEKPERAMSHLSHKQRKRSCSSNRRAVPH